MSALGSIVAFEIFLTDRVAQVRPAVLAVIVQQAKIHQRLPEGLGLAQGAGYVVARPEKVYVLPVISYIGQGQLRSAVWPTR